MIFLSMRKMNVLNSNDENRIVYNLNGQKNSNREKNS